MTILRTDTVSGIGTEGTVFEGGITVDSLNYMTLPKGTTDQRYSLEGRDPHYHKLKLHLPLVHHTQFEDYSPASPSVTANYETHISSKSGVFENSAALLSRAASNDWISISDSTDLDLGTDDFTIECWFMCVGGGTDGNIIQKGYNAGTWSYVISFKQATDSINFYATTDGTNFDIVNGTSFGATILAGRWYHLAVCRSGNTFSYYIDGRKGKDTDTSSASLYNSSIEMRIKEPGGFGGTEDVFIQDVRLYKGVAKYSDSFTPQKLAEDGAIRYNTDSNKIECYDGTKWMNIAVSSPDLGNSTNSDNHGGGRVVYGAGNNGSDTAYIDYITVPTAGNAVTFGTATATSRPSGTASKTRGLINGGQQSPTMVNVIQYITISSIGNADDFGDLSSKRWYPSGVANQTRSVTAGGYTDSSANTDVIDYVTIASTGNATNFGDTITGAKREHNAGSSPTRGIFAGGQPGSGITNLIDYITIASTGKVTDFGDLSIIMGSSATATSSTRMLIGGGLTPGAVDDIQSLTMATLGNSVNFGNITRNHGLLAIGASSDRIRGVFAGGATTNIMDYVAIATEGNAQDFGDLTQQRYSAAAMSNSHGGL